MQHVKEKRSVSVFLEKKEGISVLSQVALINLAI